MSDATLNGVVLSVIKKQVEQVMKSKPVSSWPPVPALTFQDDDGLQTVRLNRSFPPQVAFSDSVSLQ